jgi:predicted RNase H-like nuclease (RuvC/YqgF family)
MATKRQEAILARITKVLGFFIGIFGALAILGVFFKILKYPNWELFMQLGFIGEAAAFVIMGSLELGQAFIMETPSEEELEEEGGATAASGGSGTPVRASARKMIEKKVNDDLNVMMGALGKEIRQFGGEIHEMVGEMKRARVAVQDMRSKLSEVASGDLAKDAERLGKGMNSLGTEMSNAGSSVEQMRSDLEEMLRRFRSFNDPQAAPNGQKG